MLPGRLRRAARFLNCREYSCGALQIRSVLLCSFLVFARLLLAHFLFVLLNKKINGGETQYEYQHHHRRDEIDFSSLCSRHNERIKDEGLRTKDRAQLG